MNSFCDRKYRHDEDTVVIKASTPSTIYGQINNSLKKVYKKFGGMGKGVYIWSVEKTI